MFKLLREARQRIERKKEIIEEIMKWEGEAIKIKETMKKATSFAELYYILEMVLEVEKRVYKLKKELFLGGTR